MTTTRTVDSVAARLQGTVVGDGSVEILALNAIDEAHAGDLTFISTDAYAARWVESNASVAVCTRGVNMPDDPRPRIEVDDAEIAMITLLEWFAEDFPSLNSPGIDPAAAIHPSATVDPTASIEPLASVGPKAVIGRRVHIHAGARIGAEAVIRDDAEIHANAVVGDRCVVGHRTIVFANATLGADGFGFRARPDGSGLARMPHLGSVILGDDVEIGANSCVDRAKFGATRVGDGTKIDNLCQIGHNVRIGRHCVLVASVCLAGSVKLGDGVQIGGQAAIKEHVTVGDGVKIWGKSGVSKDVRPNQEVAGYPAAPASRILREWAALRRLPKYLRLAANAESTDADASNGSAKD